MMCSDLWAVCLSADRVGFKERNERTRLVQPIRGAEEDALSAQSTSVHPSEATTKLPRAVFTTVVCRLFTLHWFVEAADRQSADGRTSEEILVFFGCHVS